jgi:hypothetical protein
MFERHITHRFLAALEQIEFGAVRVITPDGLVYVFKGSKPGA